jgi:vitamin B12 transporter
VIFFKYCVSKLSTAGAVGLLGLKMKNKLSTVIKTAIPLLLLSTTFQIATAEESVSINKEGGLELSITANRTPQEIKNSVATMSIITKQDIQKYQATSVTELLRRVPGISIINSGGMGKQTSVSMRGTNTGHLLVLVDGVKIGSATLGAVSFQHLPVSEIERIEIVRGPRSSLYGSEAIGGVIQIFTSKRKHSKVTPEFSLGYGSHNTLDLSFGVSGGNENNWFQVGAGKLKSDGINARPSYTAYPAPNYTPTEVKEKDKDGYQRTSVSLNLGHQFASGVKTELNIMDAIGDTEYDGSSQNESDFHQQAISAKVSAPLASRLKLTGVVGTSLDDTDSFINGVKKSSFTTKSKSVSLLADFTINPKNTLILGSDFQKDKISGSTKYTKTSRNNKAIFTSLQSTLGMHNIEASVRLDDNQQFGKHTTGNIGIGHNFSNGLKLTTSYGTAFKAPTFNDLYYPKSGNANLKPEESKNIEIGLTKATTHGVLSASLFQNKIENMIAWAPDAKGNYAPANVDAVKIKGIELGHKLSLAGWDINPNISYLKAEVDAGVNKGQVLRYRPEKLLSLDIDRQFGKFKIGTTLQAESKRYTSYQSTVTDKTVTPPVTTVIPRETLAGYATLGLRTEYALSKDIALGVKINNILDKDYKTNKGYNQDGVNGMLTIKYTPR